MKPGEFREIAMRRLDLLIELWTEQEAIREHCVHECSEYTRELLDKLQLATTDAGGGT